MLLLAVFAAATTAASTGICWPKAASAEETVSKPQPDTVARYLESGGRIPAWAKSPSIRAALSDEAARHGVTATASTNGGAPEVDALSAALRLAGILASGAVAPSAVQRDWAIPVPEFAPDAALRTLVALDDPLPWLRGLAPQDEGYRQLQRALAKYRAIAEQGGWPAIPPGPGLKLGASGERVAALQSRLKIEGDLAPDVPVTSVFDADTERALRNFQSRHDLAIDGRIGRDTLAAMNVDAWQRHRQIAANMERRRWLTRWLPPDRVMVNAAAARLALFDAGSPVLELRTIVGKPRSPTPVLTATIGSLLFNPPWEIPPAIAAREIRPLARRDPTYLQREGIVAVGDGKRLRQLPGPKNALGQIKFEMPNPLNVYLHDTPSKALFKRPRRFFSHGCIRLENPRELALRLLRHDPAWTTEAIDNAISAGETSRVPISPTIPIFVVYFTAVAEASGEVQFFDDVYRRDQPLIGALFAETPALSGERQQGSVGCPPG